MDTFDLPPDVVSRLRAYAAAVEASPHNLLSKRALEELWDRHIAEGVAFARSLPADASGRTRVLDLGTGGGLPGMVVAIVRPEFEVTLLDATAKKISFLEETAAELEVPVATMTGRAEDLAVQAAGSFDIVTARAVAALDQLVVWSLPFLRAGGTLHAIKGARWAQELRAALPVIEKARASVTAVPDGPTTPPQLADAAAPKVVTIRAAG